MTAACDTGDFRAQECSPVSPQKLSLWKSTPVRASRRHLNPTQLWGGAFGGCTSQSRGRETETTAHVLTEKKFHIKNKLNREEI